MLLVPAATPITTPEEFTVATAVFEDSHGDDVAGVPEPVNVVVKPMHVFSVPEIAGGVKQPLKGA